eukprot:3584853-Amphidinium_carterae.1
MLILLSLLTEFAPTFDLVVVAVAVVVVVVHLPHNKWNTTLLGQKAGALASRFDVVLELLTVPIAGHEA